MEFKPGKKYICNGYLLVASESGVDLSSLALASSLEELESKVEKKAEALRVQELENQVRSKENKTEIYKGAGAGGSVEIKNGARHILGLQGELNIVMPQSLDDDFYSVVAFRSGSAPTIVSVSGDLIFVDDDCINGSLFPVSSRAYELHIHKIEDLAVANVISVDYEVIS